MREPEQSIVSELHADLAKVGPLVKAVWVLVVGAFLLGGWVTTIQWQLNETSSWRSHQDQRWADLQEWRESQGTGMSTLIERVNTIRDDVKELKARWVKN